MAVFTTEVWTARRLVTYYTAFVIELHTRRVSVLGSTRHTDGAFVVQAKRGLVSEAQAILREGRILLCNRNPNWTSDGDPAVTEGIVALIPNLSCH
jgi:hypothetical protein